MPLIGVLIACRDGAGTRAAELEKCTIVGGVANPQPSGEAVTRCLILQYDWDGQAALAAGAAYQAQLDSVQARLDAVAQQRAQAASERERRVRDSLATVRARTLRWHALVDSLNRECWSLSYRLDADSTLTPLDRAARFNACRDAVPSLADRLAARRR